MNRKSAVCIIIVALTLAACAGRQSTGEPSTPIAGAPTSPPVSAEARPTATTAAVDQGSNQQGVAATKTEDSANAAGSPAGSGGSPAIVASESVLPTPSLFETSWDDRSRYQPGLLETERPILAHLPGASIYHLTLDIADGLNQLSGREEVRYTNMETVPLNEVYFHLYPNLLGGSINILALTVNGEAATPQFSSNDSAMQVPLSEPLQPGQRVVIGMEFAITVPDTQERNYGIFAQVEGILALAHFYPLIAVYEDGGWDIEVPSPQGDVVYADTSFYQVQVTAPQDQVVTASGLLIDEARQNGRQTLTFTAGPMRDFYIASSNQYSLVSQTVGDTVVNSYFLPGREASGQQALQYAVNSLKSFNARYGTYPFVELDIVPTANLALGIEYPGIVVINHLLYDPNHKFGDVPTSVFFESTVAHEVAHQWFYSLVGNDQLEEPWVDESLTQYATWRYYLDVYGQGGADGFRSALVDRMERLENPELVPIGLPVSAYDEETPEYSAIVYGRGPLFFEALAAEIGQDRLDQFLLDYAQTFRWSIATTEDLKRLAEQHCTCDLTPLFQEWVFE